MTTGMISSVGEPQTPLSHEKKREAAGSLQHGSSLELYRLSSSTEALLLLPLAREAHGESIHGHLGFSERKFLAAVMATLNRQDSGAAFYVARGPEVIGLINLVVGEAWLSEGGCYATCLQWFVSGRIRKTMLGARAAQALFNAATTWASSHGATAFLVHGTHGLPVRDPRRGRVLGTNVEFAI